MIAREQTHAPAPSPPPEEASGRGAPPGPDAAAPPPAGGGEDEDEEAAGDPEEAEARLRAAVAEAEGAEDGFAIFEPLTDLCIHLVRVRRRPEAIPLARRLIELLRAHRPDELRRRGAAHQFLGQMLSAEGQHAEAETALRRALRCVRRAGAGHDGTVAQIHAELAELRERQGRMAEARGRFRRALRVLRDSAEWHDRDTIDVHLRLSRFYDRAEDLDRALRHARRAARRLRAAGQDAALEKRRVELTLALALWRLGLARIAEGRLAEAQLLAEELAAMDPARGYRLLADVHEEAGRPAEVVRALLAGTRGAPGDWELWQRLGDACAAQALFGEADHAYAQALRCPDVEAGLIHYQAALNSQRRERPLEALYHLEQVRRDELGEGDGHLYWDARALRLALCRQVGRSADAEALAAAIIDEAAAVESAAAPAAREEAAALLCLGRAIFYQRGDRAAARAFAIQSFRRDPRHLSLGLLREADGLAAERRTQCWRLTMRIAVPDGEGGVRRSRRGYLVQALSLTEAIGFIQALECGEQERAVELELVESSRVDVPAVGLRGVHLAADLEDEPAPGDPQ